MRDTQGRWVEVIIKSALAAFLAESIAHFAWALDLLTTGKARCPVLTGTSRVGVMIEVTAGARLTLARITRARG